MLAHFCSLMKKMFTVLTPKTPKNHQATVCNCSKQEERHHDKTPAHKIMFRKSLTASTSHKWLRK